jgi:hypothetical protein
MEGGRPVYPKSEIISMKPVVWLGDSLDEVRSFVPEARRRATQNNAGPDTPAGRRYIESPLGILEG